jgi:hypothetical protein
MSAADAGRPSFDIANIVRLHRMALEAVQPLSPVQGRALSAMALCRTAALGGHAYFCAQCGLQEDPSYNSCRNRNCPKCQALDQERWIATRSEAILPISHYHGVFTLPEDLRPLARQYPRAIYDSLFRSASAATLELAEDRLKVRLGLTLVLHTWTRDLRFHPHVHVLVTAGGLPLDGKSFKHLRKKVLLHVKPLAALFKGKMMDALRTLRADAVIIMTDGAFGTLMASLQAQDWHVYLKRTFRRPEDTLQYLGRYTHRVGISNSRLVEVTDAQVTFRTKAGATVTLTPVAFLQRFVQHVLPDGFKKIRHAGLYAAPKALAKAKADLGHLPVTIKAQPTPWEEALLELTGRDVTTCAGCKASLFSTLLAPIPTFSRRPRAAPPRNPP